ncbi:TetR family transcriptional regulator [Mycobacterium intracellulare]|uniref:TetR family transcriptional regulator n=1 Tax=Mycobacterium intracellulare TaxID=1767 RepID=UPI001CDA1FA7|nr:TetR family transcriptional regulator [Mycobacterium intracellulare]MCA2277054.1 TetR family transcriptional regulator [Mycobacterium intracellulare]MCA2328679.1 TetR family transcriptional regulator [Mycobacterium intracellulare]
MAEGLRQRKRQRTRETIVREALRLFHERGFDATTINDIANNAEIARRTFFTYFPAKEAVAFTTMEEDILELEVRLANREPREGTLDTWAAWALERHKRHTNPAERARRDLVRATPSLSAYERNLMGRIEELLAQALAKDLDTTADASGPRLAAASATALMIAMTRSYDEATSRRRRPSPAPSVEASLDDAMAFLRAGLTALSVRPQNMSPIKREEAKRRSRVAPNSASRRRG